jgi:hypothetical protein
MKYTGHLRIFLPSVVFIPFILCALAPCSPVQARQICKATVNCLQNWNNDTLVLPDNIVMLSNQTGHCSPTYYDENWKPGSVDTVSVFIIIDQSGSMSFTDSMAMRYQIARTLIDSIYAKSPASEVGIAVFSNQLMYNYQSDPFYVQLDPASGWPDSYAPLTRLNTQVGAMSAVNKLKQALALSTTVKDAGGNWQLLNGFYGPTGRHDGHAGMQTVIPGYNGATDISLAFEAAKKAFQTARYPAAKQFIVFLSDGEPQYVDVERQSHINDFMTGAGTPTTFTAFWINPTQPVPATIQTMTDNIRNNGYSTTNKLSRVWKTQGAANDFLSAILNIAAGSGARIIPSSPVRLIINNDTTTNFDSTTAYFNNDGFPLQGAITNFRIAFTYHYAMPWDIDSTRTFQTTIQTQFGVPLPSGIAENCWDQGSLQLVYQGNPVNEVEWNWTNLEVRFYPSPSYPVTSVPLVISNAAKTDSLSRTAADKGPYFSTSFTRAIGTPIAIDSILQNAANDSIIIIYRNPKLPMDIVRLAVRVKAMNGIASAAYADSNADGLIDAIRVKMDKAPDQALLNAMAPTITLPSYRNFSYNAGDIVLTSDGFEIHVSQPANTAPFTGVDARDRLGIGFINGDVAIEDAMAPVIVKAVLRPAYVDVEGSTAPDTLIVTFSENIVKPTSLTPFALTTDSNVSYSMELMPISGDGTSKYVFAVRSIQGVDFPRTGDTIRINPSAGVNDGKGNTQTNPKNRATLLEVTPLRLHYTVIAVPNPCRISGQGPEANIPQSIRDLGTTEVRGVVIVAKPIGKVASTIALSGKATLYDVLGNIIFRDREGLIQQKNQRVLFVWDGTNQQGRLVATGAYLAAVTIQTTQGLKETQRIKIGIEH